MTNDSEITKEESEIYDRQIRLWGVEAQKRLRASKVLMIGSAGLSAEVSKNIVLAGIKSLTILDHRTITEEDRGSQFLINWEDIGKNRAEGCSVRIQKLNPLVEINVLTDTCEVITEDFIKQFNVVCATLCPPSLIVKIDQMCLKNEVLFYAGDIFGYYGFMFANLGNHSYTHQIKKPLSSRDDKEDNNQMITVEGKSVFCPFENSLCADWSDEKKLKKTPTPYFIMRVLLNFRAKHGRPFTSSETDILELRSIKDSLVKELKISAEKFPDSFERLCVSELSPVCAIVGGILAQEIIKALSQNDKPHNNFFFYDGPESTGYVDCITN